jgi:RasGEF domain
VAVVEHWIEIAKRLEKLQDLNGCMALVGGLGNSAVARLKLTWAKISRRSMRTFERLSKLSSGLRNYKTLRDRLRYLKPPGVPYIGMCACVCGAVVVMRSGVWFWML